MRWMIRKALEGFFQGFFFVLGERVAIGVFNTVRDWRDSRHPFPGSSRPPYPHWPHG